MASVLNFRSGRRRGQRNRGNMYNSLNLTCRRRRDWFRCRHIPWVAGRCICISNMDLKSSCTGGYSSNLGEGSILLSMAWATPGWLQCKQTMPGIEETARSSVDLRLVLGTQTLGSCFSGRRFTSDLAWYPAVRLLQERNWSVFLAHTEVLGCSTFTAFVRWILYIPFFDLFYTIYCQTAKQKLSTVEKPGM